MGFSDDLFETPPSQHLICAVCHDVFRDASMLRCGHTFCHNCILKTLARATPGTSRCPICRVPTTVKDISPNLITRQLISDLPIRCVQGEYRRCRCGWRGTVGQWAAHCAKTCPNQELKCNLDGCTWRYHRRHRSQHLKAKHLYLYINEQNERHCKNGVQMIQVQGAKARAVNGIFFLDGFNEKGTAVYKRQLIWNGVATTCVIGRYLCASTSRNLRDPRHNFCVPCNKRQDLVAAAGDHTKEQKIETTMTGRWYISIVPLGCKRGDIYDIDLYYTEAPHASGCPPSTGWHDIRDAQEERTILSLTVRPYYDEEEEVDDESNTNNRQDNPRHANDGVAQRLTSECPPAKKKRRTSALQAAVEATVCLDGGLDSDLSCLFSDSSLGSSFDESSLSEWDDSPADSVREINVPADV